MVGFFIYIKEMFSYLLGLMWWDFQMGTFFEAKDFELALFGFSRTTGVFSDVVI